MSLDMGGNRPTLPLTAGAGGGSGLGKSTKRNAAATTTPRTGPNGGGGLGNHYRNESAGGTSMGTGTGGGYGHASRNWIRLFWTRSARSIGAGRYHLHSDYEVGDTDEEEEDEATVSQRFGRVLGKVDSWRRTLAISRKSGLVVIFLFFLGLWEMSRPTIDAASIRDGLSQQRTKRQGQLVVKGRDPFKVLQEIQGLPSTHPHHLSLISSTLSRPREFLRPASAPITSASTLHHIERNIFQSTSTQLDDLDQVRAAGLEEQADTTAIVLNWKRTENVVVIVASLCQYSFFQTVLVWNNNPDVFLTREMFHSTHCPTSKLRIYNSPTNLYFLSRYLACSTSSTPYCFFQDDDWLVKPIRSMYSEFKRDPEGRVVVSTDSKVAVLFGWEWCFFNGPLHTCFSWVGTGAFTAKSHVLRFLSTMSSSATYSPALANSSTVNRLDSIPSYTAQELSHADNSFTTLLNMPPYVLSSPTLDPLPSKYGHSDGEGIERNKRFIHLGLQRLISLLYFSPIYSSLPAFLTVARPPAPRFPLIKLNSLIAPFRQTPPPPLAPHPFAHHSRAPRTRSDDGVFITNVNLLPPPEAVLYPLNIISAPPSNSYASAPSLSSRSTIKTVLGSLSAWENRLGWVGRGWLEGPTPEESERGEAGELFKEGETWAIKWGYGNAVDGDWGTAFRSRDVIEKDGYIGLGLLEPIDPEWISTVKLSAILEHSERVLENLMVEISGDGYHWIFPPVAPLPTCHSTPYSSTAPDESFPLTFLSTSTARSIVQLEQYTLRFNNVLLRWWKRRRKMRDLRVCEWTLPSALVDPQKGEASVTGRIGWKYVRLRAREGMDIGWGVYELELT